MSNALQSRQFWNLAHQAAERPHDTTLLGALADHVEDTEPETLRAHLIRHGNPQHFAVPRGGMYGHGRPSEAAQALRPGLDPNAWVQHGWDTPGTPPTAEHAERVTLRKEQVPRDLIGVWQPNSPYAPIATVHTRGKSGAPVETYEAFRASHPDNHKRDEKDVPVVRYTLYMPRRTLHLIAPVTREHLLALARYASANGQHVEGNKLLDLRRMYSSADEGENDATDAYHARVAHQLARMRAPAGGMVGGENTFSQGGQFLPKTRRRIRDVAARLMKLARPLADDAETPHARLTGSPFHGSDPVKPFTIRDLKAFEDSLGMAKDKRLSPRVEPREPAKGDDSHFTANKEHVAQFLDHAYSYRRRKSDLRKAMTDPRLSDEAKVAHAALHLKHESSEWIGAAGVDTGGDWYGPHVDALEKALHVAHGIKPGSPEMTIAKHYLAAASSNTNPRDNALVLHRMLREGKRRDPKNPLLAVPSYNEPALNEWLARPENWGKEGEVSAPGHTASDATTPPAAEHAWYVKHVLPHRAVLDGPSGDVTTRAGYKGRPAVIVDSPGHPDHGKLVRYQYEGKNVPVPDTAALARRHGPKGRLKKVLLPITDEHGRLQPKGWNQRGEQVENAVERVKTLITKLGTKGAADWLLSDHDDDEFRKMVGYVPDRTQIDLAGPVPGSFVLGPKFGAFAQNLHANHPDSKKAGQYARFLTADKWWSRTWNRFLGTLTDGAKKGSHVEAPRGDDERRLMVQAAHRAVHDAGLKNVAQLQAAMWYYEQSLWRMLGSKANSYSFEDGANTILKAHADSNPDKFPAGPPTVRVAGGKAVLNYPKRAKLSRDDVKSALGGLPPVWLINEIAQRMAAAGLVPTPYRLVQALLAATGDGGPVRLARPAVAPTTPEHVVYVSPSTREHSTFADAVKGMGSEVAERQRRDAMLLPTVRSVHTGLGFWKDGAEESNAVHVGDPQYLTRVGAELGRAYAQKAVLLFREDHSGPDARHVITVPETDPEKIHADMMRHGIEYKTLVPITLPGGAKGTRVEAVDGGDQMRPEFDGYAREAGALVHQVRAGHATVLGGDTRDEAKKTFEDAISGRAGSPARLSRQDEQAAFERSIDDNPLEGTAHLAYADWLDEHDQPHEASFRRAMGEWLSRHQDAHDPHKPEPPLTTTASLKVKFPWQAPLHDLPAGVNKKKLKAWDVFAIRTNRRNEGTVWRTDGRGYMPRNPLHGATEYYGPAADNKLAHRYETYRHMEGAMREAFTPPPGV